MKKQNLLIVLLLLLSVTFACQSNKNKDLDNGIYAKFDTNYGDFTAKLYYDKAPLTVANFVTLAEGTNPLVSDQYKDKKFFDSLTFHRIVKDFVIQGGDPKGTGEGGPGYQFPNETDPSLKHDTIGVLSMANAGPGTNGSQFFITLAPAPNLNGGYSVFGKTVKGIEVIDSIGQVKVDEMDKPQEEVRMNAVKIIRKGEKARDFDAVQVFQDKMEDIEKDKQAQKEKIEKEVNELAKGFKETDSGLRYKITKEVDNGKKPKPGQTVHVYYKGMLKNGKVFDKHLEEDDEDPLVFKVGTGRVIPGWDEGLQLLKEGEKARLIIPPHLGYGPEGMGPIPPNSILIFDVSLDEIEG